MTQKRLFIFPLAFLFAFAFSLGPALDPALAVEPSEILADPTMEKRAREISKNLRCLVCQNQSIDDSNAPLAKDLRVLVRERLVKGDADDEVIRYVVARYGDYVLLKPPLMLATIGLWFGPFLIFILGAFAVVMFLRRNAALASGPTVKKDSSATASLSEAEKKRLESLLGGDNA